MQVDINLKSVFLTCKHVLPHMIARKTGAIVNLASTSGLRWTGSAQVAYAATKAGVIHMSRVIAVQHAPDGIRYQHRRSGAASHTDGRDTPCQAAQRWRRRSSARFPGEAHPCSGSWEMAAIRRRPSPISRRMKRAS